MKNKNLGLLSLLSIGLGALIGAGFFVLIGEATSVAGPAVFLSFGIASIVAAFSALCYAEFASIIPQAGSAYSYIKLCLGRLPAWMTGWTLVLVYLFSGTTVAIGWSGYLISLLKDCHLGFANKFIQTPFIIHDNSFHFSGTICNLPAFLIIILIGFLICSGIKLASFINNTLVTIKLITITCFVICALPFIQLDHFLPFIPENSGQFGQFGWSGIFRGSGIIFFAFVGFDAITAFAQEAKNPQKHLPIAIFGSLGLTTIIYVIVTFVLIGVSNIQDLSALDPLAVGVNALGPKFLWLRLGMKLSIILGLCSVMLVMFSGAARILHSMACDQLLPKRFSIYQGQTPRYCVQIVIVIASIFGAFFPPEAISQLAVLGILLSFAIVCFGVVSFRKTHPLVPRPFTTPLVPIVPILGIVSCLLQMCSLSFTAWWQLTLWLLIGSCIYLFRKNDFLTSRTQ